MLQVLAVLREKDPPRPSTRLSSVGEAAARISEQRKIAPTRLRQILRGDLDWIVMKALEKDRNRRYETANGFSEDIRRYLEDEAIVARPPSTRYRVAKFVRKNRGLVTTAALIGALLIAGIITSTWFARNAEKQRRTAVNEKQRANESANQANIEKKKAMEATREAEHAAEREQTEKLKAEALAEQNRQHLVNTLMRQADVLVEVDPGASLLHSLEAQRLDSEDAPGSRMHLTRAESAWNELPKFTSLWKHDASVNHVAVDSRMKLAASSSHDRTVQVHDLESNKKIHTLQRDLPGWGSAFSPDGKTLATISGTMVSGELRLWDLKSGELIGDPATCTFHPFIVFWTPGGNIATISVSMDSETQFEVFNYDTREIISSVSCKTIGHFNSFGEIVSEQTGRVVILRSHEQSTKTVRVVDLENDAAVLAEFAHPAEVWQASISSDGSRIVSATESQLFIWDIDKQALIAETLPQSLESAGIQLNDQLRSAFSFDNRTAICASDRSVFRVRQGGNVYQSIGSRSGNNLAVENLKTLPFIGEVSWTPDPSGRFFAVADQSGTVRIWDSIDAKFHTFPMHHSAGINWFRFAPDGRQILTACTDGTVRVWDLATCTNWKMNQQTGKISPVLLAHLLDGDSVLLFGGFHWYRTVNLETGEHRQWHHGSVSGRFSFCRSPGVRFAAHGNSNSEAVVSNYQDGTEVKRFRHRKPYIINQAFSDNGKMLATLSSDSTSDMGRYMAEGFVFDIASGEEIAGPLRFGNNQIVSTIESLTGSRMETSGVGTIQISPDNRYVAYGGAELALNGEIEPKLRVRNLATGAETEFKIANKTGSAVVTSLGFSTSGDLLVASGLNPLTSQNSIAAIWNCADQSVVWGPNQFS